MFIQVNSLLIYGFKFQEIFFAGLDIKLHKEVWPFLLHYYDFHSTFDEREQVRNDKYIEYQAIRRKRYFFTVLIILLLKCCIL